MKLNNPILEKIFDGLIVSCQPVDNGPMDKPEIVAAMAKAAEVGGAAGIRIEGVDNLIATRPHVKVPIIGIVKYDLDNSPVRITPFLEDVEALAKAGADIIAFDGTDRIRPVDRKTLIDAIHEQGCLAMADCSNPEDGDFCAQQGADIIGTTLSGYTGGPVPEQADFPLIEYYNQQGYFVMAEGRVNTLQDVHKARLYGAHCITVGTVLTRLEVMVERFVKASHLA